MVPRTRAVTACVHCREKRKRCDVDYHSPCTNCRLDEVACNVPKAHRLQRSSPEIQIQVANGFLKVVSVDRSDTTSQSSPPEQRPPLLDLDYVKPLSLNLIEEDIEFLAVKGALWIPPTELRDALLCSYLDYVHPFLPILKLSQLLAMFRRQKGSEGSRVSILLFQAIMLAASAFVDEKLLLNNGFNTRREARKEMYQRVKLLAEFEVELDEITYIQSLLLMTYWYETPDDPKSMYHWLGLAITMANRIDLNRDPEFLGYDKPTCKLRKRLWWSCIIRDSAISLGMRHPTKIKNEDYDVPMLKLDDFETELLTSSFSNPPIQSQVAQDAQLRYQLAILCLQKAKLCLILSEVLAAQYTVGKIGQRDDSHGLNTKTTMGLLPRVNSDTKRLKSCEQSIRRWEEELPDETRYRSFTLSGLDHTNDIFPLHLALFHMLHHATVITFYRPWTIPGQLSVGNDYQSGSAQKVIRHAATEISSISRDLYHIKGTCFLPMTGVITLLAATVSHIVDASVGSRYTQSMGVLHFSNCYRSIQILRRIYPLADHAACVVQAAVSSSRIWDRGGDNKSSRIKLPENGDGEPNMDMPSASTGGGFKSISAENNEVRAIGQGHGSKDTDFADTLGPDSSNGDSDIVERLQYNESQYIDSQSFTARSWWEDISLDQNDQLTPFIDWDGNMNL
ncbi:hypothetical protein B7463_g10796, partial [Scytalidium lignicola]